MLTPEEIFEKEFKRSFRGYDADDVNEFLDMVIQDFSRLLEENRALKKENQQLKGTTSRQTYHENIHKQDALDEDFPPKMRQNPTIIRQNSNPIPVSHVTNKSLNSQQENDVLRDLVRRVEILEKKTKFLPIG